MRRLAFLAVDLSSRVRAAIIAGMGGEHFDNKRRDEPPQGESTPLGEVSLPPRSRVPEIEFPPPETTTEGNLYSLAQTLFPNDRDAVLCLTIGLSVGSSLFRVCGWLDSRISSDFLVRSHFADEAEYRRLPIDRLKRFFARNAEQLTAIDKAFHQPCEAKKGTISAEQFLILTSLLHLRKETIAHNPARPPNADSRVAIDLARRLEGSLLEAWQDLTRHLVRPLVNHIRYGTGDSADSEGLAKSLPRPWTELPPTPYILRALGEILHESKLLADTGTLAPLIALARPLPPRESVAVFNGMVGAIQTILGDLTKEKTTDPRTLSAMVGRLPADEVLPFISVLASEPQTRDLFRLLESSKVNHPDAAFASWVMRHRNFIVETPAGSVPLGECLRELASARPAARNAIVALITHTEPLLKANLLPTALALLNSPLDPGIAAARIKAGGDALYQGKSPAVAAAALEPESEVPPITSPRGTVPAQARATSAREVLRERLAKNPALAEWVDGVLIAPPTAAVLQGCLRKLITLPPDTTPRIVGFLRTFTNSPRLLEFLESPAAFDRLTDFVLSGRHEDVRALSNWLRGDVENEPECLGHLRGLRRPVGSAAPTQASSADSGGIEEVLSIPPGTHRRLVVIGGIYTPPKRAAIEEAGGSIPVIFLSPDDSPRTIRQTLMRHDLVAINPTWNSHATSERVMALCRAHNIPWMMVPFSGYEVVARLAERLNRRAAEEPGAESSH
ncbi:MAG: hypothetical protein RL417_230 [Pseudomonadota bacterium]